MSTQGGRGESMPMNTMCGHRARACAGLVAPLTSRDENIGVAEPAPGRVDQGVHGAQVVHRENLDGVPDGPLHHAAAEIAKPPQQEAAVHHGVDAPGVVLEPHPHVLGELVGPQEPEPRHAQRGGPGIGAGPVLRGRRFQVLDAPQERDARLGVAAVELPHRRKGPDRHAVVAVLGRVGRGAPPVMGAPPRRRVVDLEPRIDRLERPGEIPRQDGDLVSFALQAQGRAEPDNPGTGRVSRANSCTCRRPVVRGMLTQ